MTTVLDINCPDCGNLAGFTFAPYVRVETNSDKTYFENSKAFRVIEWRGHGARFHRYALYYPRVSNALENMDDLPDGYSADSWKPVKYTYVGTKRAVFRSINDEGVLNCHACPSVRRYNLNWPEDAHFQIIYRGESLWAYNRAFAVSLLEYLEAGLRKTTLYDPFLNSIPTIFQTAKARPIVVKALKEKLDHPKA